MNFHGASSSGTATRMRQNRLPPGATRPATSSASRHPLPSLAAVMSAPERRNMPHLHPQRLNGGLWFRIDEDEWSGSYHPSTNSTWEWCICSKSPF
ncbi:hypothetical protein Bca4012_083173 [Brassica carinata]|uniref:Uncharacterized protein n=1 Tax=Brassica carinata TaxID=52824 RepID=A0A8X8APV5_BRACI|nr:hypothetical protein Bca52824_029642 [Brassica carinata]